MNFQIPPPNNGSDPDWERRFLAQTLSPVAEALQALVFTTYSLDVAAAAFVIWSLLGAIQTGKADQLARLVSQWIDREIPTIAPGKSGKTQEQHLEAFFDLCKQYHDAQAERLAELKRNAGHVDAEVIGEDEGGFDWAAMEEHFKRGMAQ